MVEDGLAQVVLRAPMFFTFSWRYNGIYLFFSYFGQAHLFAVICRSYLYITRLWWHKVINITEYEKINCWKHFIRNLCELYSCGYFASKCKEVGQMAFGIGKKKGGGKWIKNAEGSWAGELSTWLPFLKPWEGLWEVAGTGCVCYMHSLAQ